WASRPSPIDGRDAHPTRKKGNYLIDEPNFNYRSAATCNGAIGRHGTDLYAVDYKQSLPAWERFHTSSLSNL
ncbi:hypothetical protein QUA99_13060, partial [Microcoleus sp. F10-B2]